MAKYILLVNWTDQGIHHVEESPKRLDTARKLAESIGAKLGDFYMTMGRYDMVVHLEAPDGATVAKFVLGLGAAGNVRTETLRAFSEEAYRKIVGTLGR